MKVPFLPPSRIADSASALLERGLRAGSGVLPINLDALVFDHLCEHEGLVFVADEVLARPGSDQVLGRTELIAGRITVCAALRERDYRRWRFTVAHELGHWELHRPLALSDREQSELFPREAILTTTATSLSKGGAGAHPEEWQANYFASHLLMPRPALRREFQKQHGAEVIVTPRGVALRDHSRHLSRTTAKGPCSIADLFETSVEATAIALEESGLVVAEPVLL